MDKAFKEFFNQKTTIDFLDFQKFIVKINNKMTLFEIKLLFEKFDDDKSGSIDNQEFMKVF